MEGGGQLLNDTIRGAGRCGKLAELQWRSRSAEICIMQRHAMHISAVSDVFVGIAVVFPN